MNPISRWRAALNLALLTDAQREATVTGIEKVAPQSPLFKVPTVAASCADVITDGAAFSASILAAAAAEQQWKVMVAARDAARATLDGSLATLKAAVEKNAGSAADVTSMGFANLVVAMPSRTVPDAPEQVLVYPGRAHGKARVLVAGVGYLGHFVAEVATDPITSWSSLPGTSKQRKLSGYPSGTKLWVRFAQVRWGLQGPWSVPVLVTIP